MPINKETIISVFTEKLTLEQWLKTINKALDEAVLTGVEIAKKGNATLSFKFTFEDGTYLESNDIVLQQGESVQSAYIQNGHLYLTLTNGTNLDAGNIKPVSNFAIDNSQHLIVNYQDGTSQDLGAIFQGNVNISGTLDARKVTGDEIIEKMTGYSFTQTGFAGATITPVYVGASKTGNKLTLVYFAKISLNEASETEIYGKAGYFTIPATIGEKLYPSKIGSSNQNALANGYIEVFRQYEASKSLPYICTKTSNTQIDLWLYRVDRLDPTYDYNVRLEFTFLLSDNLIQ